jgi:hypothetical protein
MLQVRLAVDPTDDLKTLRLLRRRPQDEGLDRLCQIAKLQNYFALTF